MFALGEINILNITDLALMKKKMFREYTPF